MQATEGRPGINPLVLSLVTLFQSKMNPLPLAVVL
jgi:hypothetical protein